eukprot:6203110-Pleurochrysis_carterae.AAC.5
MAIDATLLSKANVYLTGETQKISPAQPCIICQCLHILAINTQSTLRLPVPYAVSHNNQCLPIESASNFANVGPTASSAWLNTSVICPSKEVEQGHMELPVSTKCKMMLKHTENTTTRCYAAAAFCFLSSKRRQFKHRAEYAISLRG